MPMWKLDDGTELNYQLLGQGAGKETLLLLPGLLGAIASQWLHFAKTLATDYQVVMMDLRGHGRSTNTATTLDAETMMTDIARLLDGLSINTCHIAGYNIGGYLGLMLALNQPRRVQTLLLHATKFYWTKEAVTAMQRQFDPNIMAAKVPTYAEQLAQEHGGRNWRVLVRQAAELVTKLGEKGLSERMVANVQCPVLVSVGERDSLVPLVEAQRLARIIPQGGLLVLPGVKHPFQTIRPVPLLPMMREFHRSR